MSNLNAGAPDWQRALLAAGKLLAVVSAGTASQVVKVPINAGAIFVAMAQVLPATTIAVVGTTTGFLYPVAMLPGASPYPYDTFIGAPVLTQLDAEVEIIFGTAPTVDWYVVMESSTDLLKVAVTDLLISEDGKAFNPLGTLALGTDGTDSRALLTDATGKLLTLDQYLAGVTAARGAALPANAVLVGGSDGTDLRPLLTDSTGKLEVVTSGAAFPTQTIGAAVGTEGVMALGSDGTNARALLTDSTGQLKVIDPVAADSQSTFSNVTDGTTILAAPTSPTVNRLYSITVSLNSADSYFIRGVTSGVTYAAVPCPTIPAGSFSFGPIDVTEALLINLSSGGHASGTVFYRVV